jgi:rod shape-determining protein MreD
MEIKRKRFISAFINGLLIFAVFILRYSGLATLKIGEATPILLIPLILSITIFYSDNIAFVSAILAGLLMDSCAANTSLYNTVFFTVAAAICSVLSNHVLNRNLKAAACLSVGLSFGYFILYYLIFFIFAGKPVDYDYFILHLIPSAVYTSVWIIPFYFLQKKLSATN